MSIRFTGKFLIISSSRGRAIHSLTAWRKSNGSYSDGIYTTVPNDALALNPEVITLAHLKDDQTVSLPWKDGKSYKLFIPADVPPTAFNEDGDLVVYCVEVSSRNPKVTKKIIALVWDDVTNDQAFTDTITVTGPQAGAVISMVIGKHGSNVRHLTKNRHGKTIGKIFTRREEDPNTFIIEAYTARDVASLKTDLQFEIERKTEMVRRSRGSRRSVPVATTPSDGAFGGLAYDSESEDEEDWVTAPVTKTTPTITLAQRLEDGLARGETFDETLPTKKKDVFAELAKKCSNFDEWGLSADDDDEF